MISQLDYIVFSQGVAFLLLGVASLRLSARPAQPVSWRWLGLFGLFRALEEWLELLSFSLGDSVAFRSARLALMAVTYLCLLEFARVSMRGLGQKAPGRWILVVLTATACCGMAGGWSGVSVAVRLCLGCVAGLWSALAVYRACPKAVEHRTLLARVSYLLATYSVTVALVMPDRVGTLFPPMDNASFLHVFGFPIQLLRSVLAVGMAFILWRMLHPKRMVAERIPGTVFVVSAMVIGLTGWLWANHTGMRARSEFRDKIVSMASVSAASVNPVLMASPHAISDTRDPRYIVLKQRLLAMRKACPEFRYIYVMVMRGDRIIFSADSEMETSPDYTPPGDEYYDAPTELRDLCRGDRRTAVSDYEDRWGKWVSAFAPIDDEVTGRPIAVLGMDMPRDKFESEMALQRLPPIIVTLLALSLLIAFFAAYETQRETTEQIRASEAALRESEDRFRKITASAQDGIVVLDQSGKITFWNTAAERIFGHTAEEIVGKACHSLLAPSRFHEGFKMGFPGFVKTGHGPAVGKTIEVCGTRKDGTEFPMELSLSSMRVGAAWHAVGLIRDITERKRSEAALRESQDRYAELARQSATIAWEVDPQGLYTYISPVSEAVIGYRPDEVIGRLHFYDLHPESGREEFRADAVAVFERRESFRNLTTAVQTKDGRQVWVSTIGSPLLNPDGSLRGYRGSDTDVTERKNAEDALMANRRQLTDIIDFLPDATLAIDRDRRIIIWNRAIEKMTGIPAEEMIGKGDYAYTVPFYGEPRQQLMDVVFEDSTDVSRNYQGVKRKGDTVIAEAYCPALYGGKGAWIFVKVSPLHDQAGNVIGAIEIIRDITERKEAEQMLRDSEARLVSAQAVAHVGNWELDLRTNVVWTSDEAVRIYGIERTGPTLPFDSIRQVSVPDDRPMLEAAKCALIQNETPYDLEFRIKRANDGAERVIHSIARLVRDSAGEPSMIAGVIQDVTERRHAESQTRLHSAAINAADDLIAILDGRGVIVFANEAFQRHAGFNPSELVGQNLQDVWPSRDGGSSDREAIANVEAGMAWSGEAVCRTKDGVDFTADITVTPLRDDHEHTNHLVVVARNITERKVYEGRLDHLAHHDALTELPNRLLFSKQLASVIAEHERLYRQCAVLYIDLDRFKIVNDTLGHQAGDRLLVKVAERLASCLREGDTLARMGGDEFTVLLKNLKSPSDASAITQRMLEQMARPFEIDGTRLVVGASIGVSTYPGNANDVDGLLKMADTAMYRAKEVGRNNCQFFSDELSQANLARVELERDLRLALERDEVKVYYQPIVDVKTMGIIGAEALMRWDHPEKGMISPSLFVPVAEETGLIAPMGKMVLETACKQCKEWVDSGFEDFEMSVNVSPMQLRSAKLLSEVLGVLSETGLPPQCLNLEITETVLAKNDYGELDALEWLKSRGIRTCLDDFGIGYSSLSRLKEFPVIHMKVDGSFIRDIESNPRDRAMTESIILMAHNLGIRVTAEWIETEEQMQTIRDLNCDYAQGYLISPALPAEVLGGFLKQWKGARTAVDKG